MSHDTGALLVVGVQNDFGEGGSLAVAGACEVATGVSDLFDGDERFTLVGTCRHRHEPHPTGQGVRTSSASEGGSDSGTPLADDTSARALEEMGAAGVGVGR